MLDTHAGFHIVIALPLPGAAIAQLVEHVLGKDEVLGSIPNRSSICFRDAKLQRGNGWKDSGETAKERNALCRAKYSRHPVACDWDAEGALSKMGQSFCHFNIDPLADSSGTRRRL